MFLPNISINFITNYDGGSGGGAGRARGSTAGRKQGGRKRGGKATKSRKSAKSSKAGKLKRVAVSKLSRGQKASLSINAKQKFVWVRNTKSAGNRGGKRRKQVRQQRVNDNLAAGLRMATGGPSF